jgi:MFS family permease
METPPPGAPARSFLAEHPAFGRLWFGRGASGLAFQMQAVAVGWQVYALTHSTFELGLVGLAQFLPMVLLTLPAGHAADRYDRRLVAALALAAQVIALGVLAAGSAGRWIGIPGIFAAVTVIGAARAFERPAGQALLPTLVPESVVPRAVAWASGAFQTASIAGPALGGLLYGFGPAVSYGAAGVLAAAGALLVASIRVPGPARTPEPATLRSVFAGIGFIRRHDVVLGTISLDLFAVLLGGATALLPAFARDILRVGVWGLGALRSAPAVGSLAMTVWLAHHPLERGVGRKMFAAVTVFGLATIVFGLSRSFALSLAALGILGAADVVSVVVRSSLVQLQTPDAMRGRVSAVNALFIGTSNQLGEFESGVTAAIFGTALATVLGGIGTIAVALLWMRIFPSLRRFDRLVSRRAS